MATCHRPPLIGCSAQVLPASLDVHSPAELPATMTFPSAEMSERYQCWPLCMGWLTQVTPESVDVKRLPPSWPAIIVFPSADTARLYQFLETPVSRLVQVAPPSVDVNR